MSNWKPKVKRNNIAWRTAPNGETLVCDRFFSPTCPTDYYEPHAVIEPPPPDT